MLLSNVSFRFAMNCRRQICKYSGRITQNGFDLHYFIPSYAIANRGSTWGIIPHHPPIIQRLEVDVLGPNTRWPLNINSVHHESPWLNCHCFFMGSKATILVKYFETSTTIPFPLFVLPMRYLQFLEWEKFYVFSKTHQCNNILICFCSATTVGSILYTEASV
jgi:hypothetical protein